MPKREEVTREVFTRFAHAMLELGFSSLSPEEIQRDRERLGLVSRRRRRQKGQEVGYLFVWRGLKIKVWTTWLQDEGAFRREDQGWILIAQGDRAVHFVHPFNRTKNFLRRLYNHAKIEQQRLMRRPICPHCKTELQIVQGDKLKERGWACSNIDNHPGQTYVVLNFNVNLDEAALKYLGRDEKKGFAYRLQREEKGLPNFVMMLRRRRSLITRPKNVES